MPGVLGLAGTLAYAIAGEPADAIAGALSRAPADAPKGFSGVQSAHSRHCEPVDAADRHDCAADRPDGA